MVISAIKKSLNEWKLTDGNNAFSLIEAYGDNERGLLRALSAIENTSMMIPPARWRCTPRPSMSGPCGSLLDIISAMPSGASCSLQGILTSWWWDVERS
jgi:hypothetical protein